MPEHLLFRFGVFELVGNTGELRKEGKTQPRLQAQPLQILLMLLERPQEIVTREKIREKLWASETFVDFDHGLNTAINKLRNALDDSASNPRFIQTLPRQGYRFIAPVVATGIGIGSNSMPAQQLVEPGAGGSGPVLSSLLSAPEELPAVPRVTTRILFLLIQVMYLSFYIVSLMRVSAINAELFESLAHAFSISALLIVTASTGIPVRLYLISATTFGYLGLAGKFKKLFPFIFALDEIWALSPFLLARYIGIGTALAATAALLYVPFAQRSLLLMRPSDKTE